MLFHYTDKRSTAYKPLKQKILEGHDPLITRDKSKALKIYPHYTDKKYADPENQFGRIERHLFLSPGYTLKHNGYHVGVDGASYEYSDHLDDWHSSYWRKKAYAYADSIGSHRYSAAWLEEYLCALMMRCVKLVHIIAGVDGAGHPYQVFGFVKQ